jgi:murein L,D-transpeptidase YafK
MADLSQCVVCRSLSAVDKSANAQALHISYPNADDRKRAAPFGVAPGGAVMIHGLSNGKGLIGSTHRLYDWTLGCVAVTDQEIDEIWTLVPVGTPAKSVRIVVFALRQLGRMFRG